MFLQDNTSPPYKQTTSLNQAPFIAQTKQFSPPGQLLQRTSLQQQALIPVMRAMTTEQRFEGDSQGNFRVVRRPSDLTYGGVDG